LRDLNRVRKLWSGIPAKIADTTGAVVDCLGKLNRGDPLPIPNPFSVCPILTEKTVEGAPVVKDGQVFESIFRTRGISILRIAGTCPARADPIRYTIGWKPVIIPARISLF
jgi:hypothetical protein